MAFKNNHILFRVNIYFISKSKLMQLGLQNYQVISINNIEYTNRVRIC